MASIASLIVRIGAQDEEIQKALASVGQKAKSVDADLKKLGSSPLAGQAQKSLDTLRATMQQITTAQERVAERAKLAAAGIEQMGGASRLTDSQLKQVNRTLQEGVSAYRALGKEAPAEMQKVADAVKGKLEQPLGFVQGKIVALGAAIGTFLGAAAIGLARDFVQAGKAAFDYADALSNVSASTGISVEWLQRLHAVGITSGVTMDDLARSVQMLQRNLDNPAAIKAIREMGLNYQTIRSLKPEEQFIEIAQAIAAIEDPVDRANAGAALFGRTWAQIAPAVQGDIRKLAEAAHVMSDEQVKALDKAGDAWDAFKRNTNSRIGSILGNLILLSERIDLLPSLGPLGRALSLLNETEAAQARARLPKPTGLPTVTGPQARIGLGAFVQDVDPEMIGRLKVYGRTLEETNQATADGIVAAARFKTVQDQLFGRAVIANAEGLVKALGSTDNLTQLTTASTKKLHDELGNAIDAYRALGREVPPLLQEIYNKTIPLRSFDVKAIAGPSLEGLRKTFIAFGEAAQDGTIYARDFSYELNATQIETDSLGNAVRVNLIPQIKGASVTMERAASLADELRDRFKAAFGQIPSILREAFTGGGGLLGAMKAFGVQMADALTAPLLARLSGMASKFAGLLTGGIGVGGAVAAGAGAAIPTIAGTAINVGSGVGGAAVGAKAGILAGVGMNPATIAWTAGISAAIVGVYVGIKKLKEQRAHMEVNRLRDAFFDMQGGLEGLNPRVQELTGNLDAVKTLFAARNAQQWGAAVENINQILEVGRQRFAELQGAVGTVGEKLSGLTMITPDIQAALDRVFDQNTTAGYLGAIKELNGELEKQAKKYDAIDSALSEFGIAWTSAGKEFKQAKINETAQGIVDKFIVVRDAGVEINTQMRGFGKPIRDFIKDAQLAGVEVPESMRSIIQHAIDAGEVFDEDGEKIGSMTELGLTFGSTMETVMTKTIPDAMSKLTRVLEALAKFLGIVLPEAAEAGAEGVNDALDSIEDPEINVRIKVPDFQVPTGGYDVPEFHTGSGGVQDFGSGTLANLGGREAVVTEADIQSGQAAAQLGLQASASVIVNLTMHVDGVFSEGDLVQTVQREIVPIIHRTWEDNVNSARTNAQDILGVP